MSDGESFTPVISAHSSGRRSPEREIIAFNSHETVCSFLRGKKSLHIAL